MALLGLVQVKVSVQVGQVGVGLQKDFYKNLGDHILHNFNPQVNEHTMWPSEMFPFFSA